MGQDEKGFDERFRPLRPASTARLVVALVLGPLLWFVALLVAAVLLKRTNAIELGLLITLLSFVVSSITLNVLRLGRRREERRFADRA